MRPIVASAVLFLFAAGTSLAKPFMSSMSTAEIARKAVPAVVLIKGTDSEGHEIGGSGFLIDRSGLVVTNLHVVSSLHRVALRLSTGDVYDHVLVRSFDERRDLALLKISGYDLPTLPLGNSDSVQIGDPVVLVGNPLQLEGSVTSGVISGIRTLEDEGYRVIQTDAAANPGNSGGPLIDNRGRAIGVLTFKLQGTENLNFVVPINYVRGLISDSSLAVPVSDLHARLQGLSFSKSTAAYPSRWKSLTTGTTWILRVDGSRLYVERVFPDEATKAGVWEAGELNRDSTRYHGRVKGRLPCIKTYPIGGGYAGYSWCTSEDEVEITSLTPTRIEGITNQYPKMDKLNCTTCLHSMPPERLPFVWIPE